MNFSSFCSQLLYLSMKKQRKNGPLSTTAVFTSQFKLKSTQLQKQERHKKFTTTFSHFKQHLLQEQQKTRERKQFSKQKKPIVEHLKFIVNNKEDDFKAPRSLSKRSNSKSHMEEDKRRLQKLNNQIFEQFYEQIKVDKQKKKSTAYMWDIVTQKKFKQKQLANTVKQKIEKTALEKFKDAISKENQERQNKINQKNAQALYMLLKTGRSRNLKNRYESGEEEEDQQKKIKHIPTQPNENREKILRKQLNVEEFVNDKYNFGYKTENNRPPSAKRNSVETKQIVQNKQNQQAVQIVQQKKNRKESLQIKSRKDIQEQNKTKESLKPVSNIDFMPKNQTFQSNEQFSQNSSEESTKQIVEPIKNQKQSRQRLVEKVEKNQSIEKKQSPKVQKEQEKKKSIKEEPKVIQSIKQIKNQRQNSKENISQKSKPIQTQIPQKEHKEYKQQKQQKEQKIQRQLFVDIPSGVVIDTFQKKKAEDSKKSLQNKQQSAESSSLKQLNIQKILTTKYLQAQQQNNQPKPSTLAPPPKLAPNNFSTKQNTAKNYKASQINQDQLQVVQWNGKPKTQTKPRQKTKVQQQPKKQQIKQPLPNKQTQVLEPKLQAQENQSKLNQQQNHSEQDSLDQVLDQVAFYTQRMEDIGQYRVNSKDVYNDKSIDKELVKNYKICSYYMAHQFLYLTQIFRQLLCQEQINRDYYTISAEELIELQKEGLLTSEVDNLTRNMQESKKLLKKCYEQCKPFLQKNEQILCLDGHTNYYKKCCAMLTNQFKKMLQLLTVKPDSNLIQKRCCYLIEMFCVLKMFNSQNLKEFEQLEDITDYKDHIKTYKHLLIGK